MVVQFSGVSIAGIKTSPPEKRIVLLPWPPRECRGNIWILHLQHLNVNSQDRAAAQINAGLDAVLGDALEAERFCDCFPVDCTRLARDRKRNRSVAPVADGCTPVSTPRNVFAPAAESPPEHSA